MKMTVRMGAALGKCYCCNTTALYYDYEYVYTLHTLCGGFIIIHVVFHNGVGALVALVHTHTHTLLDLFTSINHTCARTYR